MIHPVTRLHGLARREADGRVLAADRRDGVVDHVLAIDVVHIWRPDRAVFRKLHHGTVGQHRSYTLPWAAYNHFNGWCGFECDRYSPSQMLRRENFDTLLGGEGEVFLFRVRMRVHQ